ncbi:MAG: hypothetical protein H7A36_02140 [Chlamydiales bacterium]|nr:hypothetical protein [Chlamydiales bacterium]
MGNIIVALYDFYRSSDRGATRGGLQGNWHRRAIILRELSRSSGIRVSDFLTLSNEKLEAVTKNNFLENAINAYIQIIAFLKTMLKDFPAVIWNPFCCLALEYLDSIGQYITILKKDPTLLQLEKTHAEKIDSYWGNLSVIANFLEGKKEILSAMNWEQTPEMSEKCSEIEDLKGQLLSLRAKSYKVHLGTLSFEALFEEAKKYYLNSSDQKGRDSQVIENKTLRSIVPLLQTRVEENATSPHKKIEMYLIWERILEVEPYPLTPHLPAPSAEQKEKFRLFLT